MQTLESPLFVSTSHHTKQKGLPRHISLLPVSLACSQLALDATLAEAQGPEHEGMQATVWDISPAVLGARLVEGTLRWRWGPSWASQPGVPVEKGGREGGQRVGEQPASA